MFTVIIAEKRHIDAIKNKNSLFFQNYLHDKEIAFCEWNTEGQTFTESVPDLVSLVGRHELWKAIIINPDGGKECGKINPFDNADINEIIKFKKIKNDLERSSESSFYEDNEGGTESVKSGEELENELKKRWHAYYDGLLKLKKDCYESTSVLPLQKLSTYLCFRKDMYYNYSGKNKLKTEQSSESEEQYHNHNWLKKSEINAWLTSKYDIYDQLLRDKDNNGNEDGSVKEKSVLLKEALDKLRFDQLSAEEFLSIKEQFEELIQTRTRLEEQFNRDLIITKEELHRRMTKGQETINIFLPTEVYCIALRTTEDSYANPDLAWENRFSIEYSDFAERNLLFDKMKYMVFDILPQTHEGYRNDYIRFLYAVLLMASHEIPTGIMSARKLYKLNSENTEKPLCEIASAYSQKLDGTYDLLDKEIEKIYSELPGMFSDTEAESRFSHDRAVECPFENDFNSAELFVNESDYVQGLYWNDNAENKWSGDYKVSEKTFKRLMKQPCRAIKKGVDSMQVLSDTSVSEANRLTKFQIDDLRELTENNENEMVSLDIPNLFDFDPYKKRMAEKSKKVRKIAESTMSKKTAFDLGIICVGLFLLCFLPFVFNSRNRIDSFVVSMTFAGIFLGILALILVISLIILHIPLKKALRAYNGEMQNLLNDVENATGKIAHYLTKMAGVRRGNKLLKYAENSVNSYSRDILLRKRHQSDIIRKKAFLLEEYGDYVDDGMRVESMDVSPYDYNFSNGVVYEYPAPYPSGDYKMMEFLVAGNRVPVPTEFAVRLYLTMEEIYD